MPAQPTTTDPADPQQQPTPTGDAPGRTGRLLTLVRNLVTYGKELAQTLQQSPSAETLFDVTIRFGTINIALILARITRGLRIAAGLETRLANRAARPEQSSVTARAASPRKPRAARPPRRNQNDRNQDDPAAILAAIPTAEEIAVQLRHRSIGAVLIEICGDLGIVADHPLWQEITLAIIDTGGSLVALLKDVWNRTRLTNFFPPDMPLIPASLLRPPEPPLVSAAAAATGPP